MVRGGAGNRNQRGLLLGVLLATPACGLIVGFEPRELCDDCSTSTGGAGGTHGAGGAETSMGGSEVTGANSGGATTGAHTEGGTGGDSTASGGTETGGTGGTETVGGTGGDATGGTGGDATGGTGGVSGDGGTGNGGTATTSSTGGADTGGSGGTATTSGTGGADTAGSGGSTETTSTSTTSSGGSTSIGGTGGSGGTGGAPSTCTVERDFDATDTPGAYPAHLMLGSNNSGRPWDLTWVEDHKVYFAAYMSTGDVTLAPTVIDDSGTHSASVLTTQDQYAFIAFGEFDAGEARIVMNRVRPLMPELAMQGTTEPLAGGEAPDVMGIALKGELNETLVAAIGANGDGVLAWFGDTEPLNVVTVPGPLDAVVPLDLGSTFALASIQEGALQITLVSHDLEDIDEPQPIPEAAPTASARALAGATMDDGAALAWVEGNGVYLTTLDDSGAPADRVQVSDGNNDILPMVVTAGSQIAVSWIDTDEGILYLRRFPTGLSGSPEAAVEVMADVAETRYGFGADTLSEDYPTFAFVSADTRLRVTILPCPD